MGSLREIEKELETYFLPNGFLNAKRMGGKPVKRESNDGCLLPVIARLVFVAGLAVSALDRAVFQHESSGLTAWAILGIALFVVGLGLYFASRLYLGRFFSEKVRVRPGHQLVNKGPYRYIRHPIYLGEILYFLSIPLIFGSFYGFIIMLAIIPMLLYRIGYEEKVLSANLGREYEVYSCKTWRLIPFLY